MAIIPIEEVDKRKAALVQAFNDEFLVSLKHPFELLLSIIKEIAKSIKRYDGGIDNFFHITGRIKDNKRFEEKILRNGYLYKWQVFESQRENQEFISKNLTDLFGYRIVLFFHENEKIFLSDLMKTISRNLNISDIEDESRAQDNGKMIFKLSGLYLKQYRFEIQVKCAVHHTWGEIEHKTIYKNLEYDSFYDKKKEIANALFDTFIASDRQLHSLFTMKEDEVQLIKSLLFYISKDRVVGPCKTDILASHYARFYRIFNTEDYIQIYKQYIIHSWEGTEFHKTSIPLREDEVYRKFLEEIESSHKCSKYKLEWLYAIDKLFHNWNGFNDFMIHLLICLFPDLANRDVRELEYVEGFEDENEVLNSEDVSFDEEIIRLINALGN